jgi:hypothetical protein
VARGGVVDASKLSRLVQYAFNQSIPGAALDEMSDGSPSNVVAEPMSYIL